MIGIVAKDPAEETETTFELVKDDNKPTPLLMGVAALELAVDVAVGYAAYRVFRAFHK